SYLRILQSAARPASRASHKYRPFRTHGFARSGAAEDDEHGLKILIYSRAFWPSIGGLETMMEILAEEFTAAGHQVKVATQVAAEVERDRDYEIVRLPSLKSRVQLLRWSDVCLCANVSLRGLPPIVVAPTPVVISHQGIYDSPGGFSILSEIKKNVTRFSHN